MRYEKVQYSSLEEIKKEIELSEVSKVCKHMAAAGMNSNDIQQMFILIGTCLKHSDEWIRNSGFIALYHLNRRFEYKFDTPEIIAFITQGMIDNSEVVLGTVDMILDELHEFNNDMWIKLKSK